MSELLHCGRLMSSDPIVYGSPCSISMLRAVLFHNKTAAMQFALEPGDATRYNLVIARLKQGSSEGWLITILDGGLNKITGSAVLWTPNAYEIGEAALALCGGNIWTQHLLDWWLKELFQVPNDG